MSSEKNVNIDAKSGKKLYSNNNGVIREYQNDDYEVNKSKNHKRNIHNDKESESNSDNDDDSDDYINHKKYQDYEDYIDYEDINKIDKTKNPNRRKANKTKKKKKKGPNKNKNYDDDDDNDEYSKDKKYQYIHYNSDNNNDNKPNDITSTNHYQYGDNYSYSDPSNWHNQAKAHPYEAKGHPYEAKGHPYETKGHSYEAKGHPYETNAHLYQANIHPYQASAQTHQVNNPHSYQPSTHPSQASVHPYQPSAHPHQPTTHSYQANTHPYQANTSSYQFNSHSYKTNTHSNKPNPPSNHNNFDTTSKHDNFSSRKNYSPQYFRKSYESLNQSMSPNLNNDYKYKMSRHHSVRNRKDYDNIQQQMSGYYYHDNTQYYSPSNRASQKAYSTLTKTFTNENRQGEPFSAFDAEKYDSQSSYDHGLYSSNSNHNGIQQAIGNGSGGGGGGSTRIGGSVNNSTLYGSGVMSSDYERKQKYSVKVDRVNGNMKEYLPVSDILNDGGGHGLHLNNIAPLTYSGYKFISEKGLNSGRPITDSIKGSNSSVQENLNASSEKIINDLKMQLSVLNEKLMMYESGKTVPSGSIVNSSTLMLESLTHQELIDKIINLETANTTYSNDNINLRKKNESLQKKIDRLTLQRDEYKKLYEKTEFIKEANNQRYHQVQVQGQVQGQIQGQGQSQERTVNNEIQYQEMNYQMKKNKMASQSQSNTPSSQKTIGFIEGGAGAVGAGRTEGGRVFELSHNECRKVMNELCKIFGINDPNQLIQCGLKTEKIMKTIPFLDNFITSVYHIIFSGTDADPNMKNLEDVIPILKQWKKNNAEYQELAKLRSKVMKLVQINHDQTINTAEIIKRLEALISIHKPNDIQYRNMLHDDSLNMRTEINEYNTNYKHHYISPESGYNNMKNPIEIIQQLRKILRVTEDEDILPHVLHYCRCINMLKNFQKIISITLGYDNDNNNNDNDINNEYMKLDHFLNQLIEIIQHLNNNNNNKANNNNDDSLTLIYNLQKLFGTHNIDQIFHAIQRLIKNDNNKRIMDNYPLSSNSSSSGNANIMQDNGIKMSVKQFKSKMY